MIEFFEKLLGRFKHRKRRKLLGDLRTLRHAEDDLLSGRQREDFDALLENLKNSRLPDAEAMKEARGALGKLKLGIAHPGIREFLDLFLVVGAVAFGIRGLFLQPFRIPTGSMQPTLYGIHYQYRNAGSVWDALPQPLRFMLFSRRRAELTLRNGGMLDPESLRVADGAFRTDTSFRIGGDEYTLPGAAAKVAEYAELDPSRMYAAGEKPADGFLALGDHLFVERLGLYLRPPRRGDVTVFNTEGLEAQGRRLSELSGYYYIKRLAGLPGDTLKIENNRLYIRPRGETEFLAADKLDKRFEKIFSGKGGYQGYWTGMGEEYLAPGTEYTVPDDGYFMLGDNSRFSLDSRFFGAVPRKNLVGRALWIFWPFSRRWGLADAVPPLEMPTGEHNRGSYRVMYQQ